MPGQSVSRAIERLLRRGTQHLQRMTERWTGAVAIAAGLLLLGAGAFRLDALTGGPGVRWPLCCALLVTALLVSKLAQRAADLFRLGSPVPRYTQLRREIESGGALLLLTYGLLQALGGTRAPLHPLVYAVCAFLVAFHRRTAALMLAGLALVCEGTLLLSEGTAGIGRYATHGLLMCMFAALHFAFLRGELLRQRSDHRRRIRGALAAIEQQAQDFRLILSQPSARGNAATGSPLPATGSPGPSPAGERGRSEEETLLSQSAVLVLHQNLHALVDLLKKALHLHTCALFWRTPGGGGDEGAWKPMAVSTDSLLFSQGPVAGDAGILGTVVKSRSVLNLAQPKPGQLPYYRRPGSDEADVEIAACVAVPMEEGRELRAVLCADRAPAPDGSEVAFLPEEETLLLDAAVVILRSVQSERVFAAVERSKYEHERLYRSVKQLAGALTPEQVHAQAFAAARELCAFDFAALTRYDEGTQVHSVLSAIGDEALCAAMNELRFDDHAGLIAMAVKNRTPLPPGGETTDLPLLDPSASDERARLRGFASRVVVPLIYGGSAIGSLVLLGKAPGLVGRGRQSRLDLLCVIASQIAVSLENARMYQAMEAMATTDGLTGLSNRRTFQERLAEMLQRAERQERPVSLVLCDIDHFKRINDTYGHLVGDLVLRRVAQVVQACARKVDVAARYGGEEFAVILENTDAAGARLFADRVRQEVQRLVMATDGGTVTCTLSLGVATLPEDGHEGRLLIEHADQALYYAKRNGRNRAVTYRDVASELRSAA